MTVAELIEILKTFPPSAKVFAQCDDCGSFDINSAFETGGQVMLDYDPPKKGVDKVN